ncbi:MAG: hypothetical protein QOG33_801 [Gaiellales bacterium]|nr:hypothetical protein [Gaiellales bacterium]
MRVLRAARPALSLAWARARAGPGRGLLVAAGVAVATAGFGAVIGAGTITAELATRRAAEHLDVSQRQFTLGWYGVPPAQGYASIDARATAALGRLSGAPVARSLIFPRLNLAGSSVDLAAVRNSGRYLRLTSGRLPAACLPERCEVVQVGTVAAPDVIAQPGLRLVRVGVAEAIAPLPLPGRAQSSAHGARAPFLVAGSVDQLSALPVFSSLYRAYGWSTPLEPHRTHVWDIEGLLHREAQVQSSLFFPGSNFRVAGPDRALLDVRDRALVGQHRLLLVGGSAAALLLSFVLLAAGTLRADLDAEWRRLERRGARLWQRWLLAATEGAWMTLLGAAAGFAVACAAVAAIAGHNGLDRSAVLGHSLLDGRGLALMAAAWLVSLGVLLAAERMPVADARIGPLSAVDLLAAAALAAVLLAAARGRADSTDLRASDPLLPMLPALVCLAAGVVAARLVAWLARLAERAARSQPPGVRLAALWLARGGVQSSVTTGFLVVSLGLALFAGTYAGTLQRGERDQAAFQVPASVTIGEGSRLVSPLDAAPLSRYAGLARGGWAAPVLRRTGTVPLIGLSPVPVGVLGVPAADLVRLSPWRSQYGALPAAAPAAIEGIAIPPSQTTLAVTASARGVPVVVTADLIGADGRLQRVPLGAVARRPTRLAGRLAPGGGLLVALAVSLTPAGVKTAIHQAAEGGGAAVALPGSVRLSGLDGIERWVVRGGEREAAGGLTLRYTLGAGDAALLRAPQPTDGRPLDVIASADVAAAAGPSQTVQIRVEDSVAVTVHIVSVAQRFPTLTAPFVVADERTLATALTADAPGSADPGEVWLGGLDDRGAGAARALRQPPFDALDVHTRAAAEDLLRNDPLARGITLTLWAAAAVALALAIAGLMLAIAGSLRDERGDLHDLEVQGVAPATLRAQLRLRAAALAIAGVAGGLVVGLLLAASTVALVALAAGATSPQPPLVLDPGWRELALALGGFALVSALAVAAVTAGAFRERTAHRRAGSVP